MEELGGHRKWIRYKPRLYIIYSHIGDIRNVASARTYVWDLLYIYAYIHMRSTKCPGSCWVLLYLLQGAHMKIKGCINCWVCYFLKTSSMIMGVKQREEGEEEGERKDEREKQKFIVEAKLASAASHIGCEGLKKESFLSATVMRLECKPSWLCKLKGWWHKKSEMGTEKTLQQREQLGVH